MSEQEARRIVDSSIRALVAHYRGERDTEDARAYSFQAENYDDRLQAQRRLQPVVTDEERAWRRAFNHAIAHAGDVVRAKEFADRHTGRTR